MVVAADASQGNHLIEFKFCDEALGYGLSDLMVGNGFDCLRLSGIPDWISVHS